MAENEFEPHAIEKSVLNLAASMRQIKSRQADRDDVVVDMGQARVSRLELLADYLEPVFKDVPVEVEMFDFAISKGEIPRLWIDMSAFVRMSRDGREYEFVKDTSMGRTILGNTRNREKMAQIVTDYIAERLIQRDRFLEGERITFAKNKKKEVKTSSKRELIENESGNSLTSEHPNKHANMGHVNYHHDINNSLSLLKGFVWFMFGLAIGITLLFFAINLGEFQILDGWFSKPAS